MLSRTAAVLALLGLLALPAESVSAEEAASTEAMVDALNGLFGSHKGFRAVHAKGVCAAGNVQATAEAAGVSSATVFDGAAVPAMFRFSNAPGAPDASDREHHPRSLTVRLEPANGEVMDLLMINVPFVFMRQPADFAPFFQALTPDPATGKPDPDKLKAHLDAHPEAVRFIEFLERTPLSPSYAQMRYFPIHTFYPGFPI